jgi:hypothetical protein
MHRVATFVVTALRSVFEGGDEVVVEGEAVPEVDLAAG